MNWANREVRREDSRATQSSKTAVKLVITTSTNILVDTHRSANMQLQQAKKEKLRTQEGCSRRTLHTLSTDRVSVCVSACVTESVQRLCLAIKCLLAA